MRLSLIEKNIFLSLILFPNLKALLLVLFLTIVKESDAIVIEVTIDGKTTKTIVDTSDVEKTVSKVDVATQESGKDNVSKAQVIAASIVAGAVAEIVKHKETTADETILTENDEVVIEVTVGDKKADSVVSSKNVEDKTGSKKIEVVIKEHDVSSTEDKDQEIVVGTTEIVTTGVIAGSIVEAVVNDTVDTQRIISKSDSVDITVTETDATLVSSDNKVSVDTKVDVIVKETDETVKQEVNIGSETIPTSVVAGTLVAGIVSDKDTVDIIETTIKGSDKVNVEVITEDKPTSKVEKITDSESYAIGEVAGAIAETVVADKEKVSAIEQTIKKADDSVTVEVVAGDKKTEAVIDKATVEEVVSEVDVVSKDSKVDTVKEIIAVGAAIGTVAVFDSDEKKNSPKEATIKDQVVDEVEESTVTETEVVSVAVGSDKSTKTKANEVVSTDSKVIEDVQVTTDVITVGEKDVTKTQIHKDKQVVVDVEDYKVEDVTKVDRIEGVVIGEYDVQEGDTSKTTVTVSREITPVENVEVIGHVEKAAETTYGWFSGLIEKINSMLEVGDCAEDVNAAIAAEESQLQIILEKSKAGSSSEVQELDVYYDKLHESVKSQISGIKTSVNEAYADNKIPQKITFHDAKEELKKTLDVQLEETKQVVYEKVSPRTTTQKVDVDSGSIAIIAASDTKPAVAPEKTVDVVRYENVEQAQKETQQVVAIVVQDTQAKLSSWYDVLFGKIRGVIASTEVSADDKKKEIQQLITDANQEASVIITEAKKAFEFDYTVSEDCDSNVAVTVQGAQKQAIESFDNIQKIVSTQICAVEEIVVSDEDIEVIEEKVSIIESQSKRNAVVALENTTETAISVGFEGKSVTWIETTEFPASFKDVKAFAFDLPDTVLNYRLTISQIWNTIVSKKNSSTFGHVDVEKLVVRWYNVFLEQRCKIDYSTCDREVLLISLRLILSEYSLENAFTDEELNTLCTTWFKLQPFQDSTSSLQKIKQVDGMFAVSISCGFKLCTLMKVARHAGLNWHAQLTGDVFAACIARDNFTDIRSTSTTVLSNAAMLCCLKDPSELAVVSSNPEILQAAKQNGAKTVLIDRQENIPAQDFDIHFDGLDIFAESYEAFVETKAVTKVEAPVTRSWFQRVVATVADAAETVTNAVIG
ncbi:hypothetical protein G6F37_008636 [Rhizopus arrhizus]|nr:hypothetical protein G6F37_008636 [Rhizopus arrhizus]